jgi:hypothetical protein
MKAPARAVLTKVVRTIAGVIFQIFGGLLLGVICVAALPDVYSFAANVGLLPGKWDCKVKTVKTVERSSIRFDVEVRECVAGAHFAQTKTAIRALRAGDTSPTKVFEYVVSCKDYGEPEIVEIDAHTVRISMPSDQESGRERPDARSIGLRTWGDVTFVYGRHEAPTTSSKLKQ